MATIQHPLPLHHDLDASHATSDAPVASGLGGLTPLQLGATVMAVSIVMMFLLTLALILAFTNVSTLAGVGFAVYCASWLGPGFGAVFAGAIVFGRDH